MSMETEIVKHLKEEFIVPENVPENVTKRDEMLKIAKASFAILSNSDRLVPFLGSTCFPTQTQNQWLCKMPEREDGEIYPEWKNPSPYWTPPSKPLESMKFLHTYKGNEYLLFVQKLSLNLSTRWHKAIFMPYEVLAQEKTYHSTNSTAFDPQRNDRENAASQDWCNGSDSEQALFSYYGSLYGLCNKLAEHSRTPDVVLRYFGAENTLPLAGWKATSSPRQANFHISNELANALENLRRDKPNWTEEALVNSILLNALKQSLFRFELTQEYFKTYQGWYKQFFAFKNPYGETTMLVAKIYDFEDNTPKMFFPLTAWNKSQENSKRFFFIPGVGLSPLYNLDLLSKEECQTVILTDSIEIADLNQEKAPKGVVFTSSLCDSGRYEEVDWSPLKGKNLYWLIVNHSCCTMVDAYRKATSIRGYLLEKEKLELKFIQMPVKYPDKWSLCRHLMDVVEYRRNNHPEIDAENITVLSGVEFNSYLEKAENFIKNPPKDWWETAKEVPQEEEEEELSTVEQEFLMHPILPRGEAVMLYAEKNRGKSFISYVICACLTAYREKGTESFLPERFWVVNRNTKYNQHKVLYLDFENGGKIIKDRLDAIGDLYWSEEHKEKSRSNFILKDMLKEVKSYDYSQISNHQLIFDMLDKAKSQGNPGQPVDLLVIDTYSKFVGKENIGTTPPFSELLKRLRQINLSVLVVDHAKDDKSVTGFSEKLEDMNTVILLYRKCDHACTFAEPLTIELKGYRGKQTPNALIPFQIKKDPNKRFEIIPEEGKTLETIGAEMLLEYARFYAGGALNIARKLGYEKSQYFEKKKKAQELLGKK